MEEPWVDGGEVDELRAAHTMTHTDKRGLHTGPQGVNHD
jgi:hypothetical protein